MAEISKSERVEVGVEGITTCVGDREVQDEMVPSPRLLDRVRPALMSESSAEPSCRAVTSAVESSVESG